MEHYPPPQEDTAGTYLEFEVMRYLIDEELIPGQQEDKTGTVWMTILQQGVFHVTSNFGTGLTSWSSLPSEGYNIVTWHVSDSDSPRTLFFVVHCKAPGLETQAAVWQDAEQALERDLASIKGEHRQWGAVAVGKLIRFYDWDEERVVGMTEALRIDLQCRTVTDSLHAIKRSFLEHQDDLCASP